MPMATRESLIDLMRATAAQKPRAVEVPGWGTIHVRKLTVGEFDDALDESSKDKNRLARRAALLLCDESGERLFDPDDADDIALLARQPLELLRDALLEPDPGN